MKPTIDKRNSNSYIDLVSEEGDSDSESDREGSDYEDDKPADIKTRTNPTRVTGQSIGQGQRRMDRRRLTRAARRTAPARRRSQGLLNTINNTGRPVVNSPNRVYPSRG